MLPRAARARVRVKDDMLDAAPGQRVRRTQAGLAGADHKRFVRHAVENTLGGAVMPSNIR